MAGASHECFARVAAGVVGVASCRSIVFADCGKFRAGLVRFLAVSDRAFFDRGHRWSGHAVYLCHGMGVWCVGDIRRHGKARWAWVCCSVCCCWPNSPPRPCSCWLCCGCFFSVRTKYFNTPARWNWGKTAAALLLALFVVWAGYFFHVSRLTVRDGTLTATFPNWSEPIVKQVHGTRKLQCADSSGRVRRRFS